MPKNASSAEHVVNAINALNDTQYTVSDLVFDKPVSTPLASKNSTLNVRPARGSELDEVVLTYNRWNLPGLFVLNPEDSAYMTVVYGVGIRNTYDLLTRLNQRFGTRFEDHEFVMEEISTETLPVTYTLKAKQSLAVVGNLIIELVADESDATRTPTYPTFGDLAYPHPVEVTLNATPVSATASGELRHSVGISADNMVCQHNREVQLGLGAQLNRDPNPPQSSQAKYTLTGELTELGWSIPLSITLLNDTRGQELTELYEFTLKFRSLNEPERERVWVVEKQLGEYALVDRDSVFECTGSDVAYPAIHSYLNARLLVPLLNIDVPLKGSVPVGKYEVTLTGDPIDTLVVNTVVVSILVDIPV